MSHGKNGKNGKAGNASDGAVTEGHGEWDARDRDGNRIAIPESLMRRDEHGGYAFRDKAGLLADFPPGTLACVWRAAAPEVAAEAGK